MTITEVAEQYGMSADTIRYYERIGLIPTVNRRPNGIRDFTETDCNWVAFSKCMRSAGLSIESLIEYVTMFQQGDATVDARKHLLIEQRDELAARIKTMEDTLERLNAKIDSYEERILKYEDEKLRP